MERYGQAVMQAAPSMRVQHYTNILWVRVMPSSCPLLCATYLCASCTYLCTVVLPAHLQALGKRNCLPASVDLESFVAQAVQRLPEFNPQNLANLLWALAVFRVKPKAFDPEEHARWYANIVVMLTSIDAALDCLVGSGAPAMTRHCVHGLCTG